MNIKKIITTLLPEMIDEEVFISRFGMRGQPWSNLNDNKNPDWWQANNKIKHQRNEHFEMANLKNAFNSIGALLITNLYYYKFVLENEKGKELTWKQVTGILESIISFIKVKNEYYYSMIVE